MLGCSLVARREQLGLKVQESPLYITLPTTMHAGELGARERGGVVGGGVGGGGGRGGGVERER